MEWTVDDIIRATGGRLLCGNSDQRYGGVAIDSRQVDRTMLFVAIRGQNHDGHDFIEQVVDQGVRGVVVQSGNIAGSVYEVMQSTGVVCVDVADTTRALGALAAFQRDRYQIPVVAITGSSGKTTTRRMMALVMQQRYHTLATRGNLNNEIGLPLTLFNLTVDHQAAVVELGMNHAGEIDRLGAICRPTIGVITNVGPAHLEFLHTLEGVANAKGELLAHVQPDGCAILNLDDPLVAAMAAKTQGKVLYYGMAARADVRAESIVTDPQGTSFELHLPGDKVKVQLKTSGHFMVSNALAAAAAGHLAGLGASQIKKGLALFEPVKGRLSVQALPNGVHLIDDTYNANPASMAAAFDVLHAMKGKGRAFTALGDMLELGDQAERLHREVGQMAAQSGIVQLYAHGEYAESVLAGAREEGMQQRFLVAGEKTLIANDLIQKLKKGDWLLVKGSRGMAMETVVAAVARWAQNQKGAGPPQ